MRSRVTLRQAQGPPGMTVNMTIIDGKAISAALKAEVKAKVEEIAAEVKKLHGEA